MRTTSGDNPNKPHTPNFDYTAYAKHERAAVTDDDVRDFLRSIRDLETVGKKATGNSGNLPSGIFVEHARQIARKRGWAIVVKGEGWKLTDTGRATITPKPFG